MTCKMVYSMAVALLAVLSAAVAADELADPPPGQQRKRLLLIGQGPDGHPWSTHEYLSAMHVVATLMDNVDGLQIVTSSADEPWKEGPELLDGADSAVVFVSEGARWLRAEPARLAAFQRLAQRGGGLVVLHWGMGTKSADDIPAFVELFGGCHGGPDRKYRVVTARPRIANPRHPIMRGLEFPEVRDEFYYTLKFAKAAERVTPLLQVPIDEADHTVAWAYSRQDAGRSFGFSGLHFHENWRRTEYRRMVAQGILWTLRLPIPPEGFPVDIPDRELKVQRPQPATPPTEN